MWPFVYDMFLTQLFIGGVSACSLTGERNFEGQMFILGVCHRKQASHSKKVPDMSSSAVTQFSELTGAHST